jgi:pSer/pThr/pTyr-binding forkhead associated (FHA) protein
MDVQLVVAPGKAGAKQIALGPETLIGRSPECNLRIASGQVSRKHCLIRIADGRVSVRDLGSANGTRLNGQTIASKTDVAIAPGSTLVVGPLKFIVKFTAPRQEDDTELLQRGASATSSEIQELQELATAPAVDGEETKDYPPSRSRQRGGAAPPLAADQTTREARREEARGDERPRQARTTEADFDRVSSETVFDSEFAGDAGSGQRAAQGNETDFIFEEDDLQQLAAAVEGGGDEAQVADFPPGPDTVPPETSAPEAEEKKSGWRLLDMLRRKKKPPAQGPALPSSDDDDALNNFLKDQ